MITVVQKDLVTGTAIVKFSLVNRTSWDQDEMRSAAVAAAFVADGADVVDVVVAAALFAGDAVDAVGWTCTVDDGVDRSDPYRVVVISAGTDALVGADAVGTKVGEIDFAHHAVVSAVAPAAAAAAAAAAAVATVALGAVVH